MSATSPPPNGSDVHSTHSGDEADFRIAAATTLLPDGEAQRFEFQVLDPDGDPVTAFEDRHERAMHLIVVSHDLNDYAHLHPDLAEDGTWSVEVPPLEPGGYRFIADTVPVAGPDLALTLDVVVPGATPGRSLPRPTDTVTVADMTVTLDLKPKAGGLSAELVVRRNGSTVEPDPYLGARGHLVAIDTDALAYLHVHPDDDASPGVTFSVADPTPGRYRLFFDFSVGGQIHTAAFTVDVTATAAGAGQGHR